MHRNEEAYVNLIDLVNSLLTSIYFLIANIGFDTVEHEPINFHNFSSLQGLNFHRAVASEVSGSSRALVGKEVRLHEGVRLEKS